MYISNKDYAYIIWNTFWDQFMSNKAAFKLYNLKITKLSLKLEQLVCVAVHYYTH